MSALCCKPSVHVCSMQSLTGSWDWGFYFALKTLQSIGKGVASDTGFVHPVQIYSHNSAEADVARVNTLALVLCTAPCRHLLHLPQKQGHRTTSTRLDAAITSIQQLHLAAASASATCSTLLQITPARPPLVRRATQKASHQSSGHWTTVLLAPAVQRCQSSASRTCTRSQHLSHNP